MNLSAFRASLHEADSPPGLAPALEALWVEAKGDWAKAHRLAQCDCSTAGAWVHAYLHRVEGDSANAGYWYRRAGRSASTAALSEEWSEIATALLSAAASDGDRRKTQ